MTTHAQDWTISLAERPGSRGAPVLKFLFGRAGGHVFLLLRNEHRNVVGEIHPTVIYPHRQADETDYESLRRVPRWTRWLEYADTFALIGGQHRLFRGLVAKAGLARHRNILRFQFFDRAQAKKITTEHILDRGNAAAMQAAWQNLQAEAAAFNRKQIVYSQLGPKGEFNCQAALHDVTAQCGYDVDAIPFTLWISGWDRNASIGSMAREIFAHRRQNGPRQAS
jgi:hypothetical protein